MWALTGCLGIAVVPVVLPYLGGLVLLVKILMDTFSPTYTKTTRGRKESNDAFKKMRTGVVEAKFAVAAADLEKRDGSPWLSASTSSHQLVITNVRR